MAVLMWMMHSWMSRNLRLGVTAVGMKVPPAYAASQPASARAVHWRESVGDHAPVEKLVVALMLSAAS